MKKTAEVANNTEDIAAAVERLRSEMGACRHLSWRFREYQTRDQVQVVAIAGKDPMRQTEGATHPPGED